MTSPSGSCLYRGTKCPEEIRNSTRLLIRRDLSFPRDSWQPFYWLGAEFCSVYAPSLTLNRDRVLQCILTIKLIMHRLIDAFCDWRKPIIKRQHCAAIVNTQAYNHPHVVKHSATSTLLLIQIMHRRRRTAFVVPHNCERPSTLIHQHWATVRFRSSPPRLGMAYQTTSSQRQPLHHSSRIRFYVFFWSGI